MYKKIIIAIGLISILDIPCIYGSVPGAFSPVSLKIEIEKEHEAPIKMVAEAQYYKAIVPLPDITQQVSLRFVTFQVMNAEEFAQRTNLSEIVNIKKDSQWANFVKKVHEFARPYEKETGDIEHNNKDDIKNNILKVYSHLADKLSLNSVQLDSGDLLIAYDRILEQLRKAQDSLKNADLIDSATTKKIEEYIGNLRKSTTELGTKK